VSSAASAAGYARSSGANRACQTLPVSRAFLVRATCGDDPVASRPSFGTVMSEMRALFRQGSIVKRHPGSKASQVAGAVMRARRRFFRVDDFEGSRAAVDRELCRLVAAGELRRVRNGLYWRGPQTMLGIAPPTLDEILEEIVGGYVYGPAGVSAANAFGLTSQVPGRSEVAVTGRPPRDLPTVRFVQRAGRRGRQAARLRPPEVGFLEILNDFDEVVEDPSSAVLRLSRLLDDGTVRRDALLEAARTEPLRVRRAVQHLADHDLQAAHEDLLVAA